MKRLIVLFQFLILTMSLVFTQNTFCVDILKSSSITINGTTNLVSFKLTQSGEKLTRHNFIITATQHQNKVVLSQNEQTILVKDFNSVNKMALRDFLKLVKAQTYPSINIKLNSFEIDPNYSKKEIEKGNVSVDLTITGETKHYIIPVKLNHEGDIYNLDGNKKFNIRDFGLVPPVEMLGLIRVNEWISIDFNLKCKIINEKTSSEFKTIKNTYSGH